MVDVDCTYVNHTSSAILIKSDRDVQMWLPFSQIEHDLDLEELEPGQAISIEVREWLAEKEGLV